MRKPSMRMTTEQRAAEDSSASTSCHSPQSTPSTQRTMTPDTRCEELVEFTDQTGTRRRLRFVPCQGDEWQRIEEVWQDTDWRLVGQDTVSDVDKWSRPV